MWQICELADLQFCVHSSVNVVVFVEKVVHVSFALAWLIPFVR